MANTYTKLNIHIVFHVKSTGICLRREDLPQVFAYIGGIIKNIGGYPVTVGGVENHIHILATMPKTMSVSDFVKTIKANSSRWIKTLDGYYESLRSQSVFLPTPSDRTQPQNYHLHRDFLEICRNEQSQFLYGTSDYKTFAETLHRYDSFLPSA